MKKPENTTAIWIRAKLRANQPFLLDELTPSGLKLFVALGWKVDKKGVGYRGAKNKVAERVPTRDWSLIDPESPESYPQKNTGKLASTNVCPETYPEKFTGKWGGHLKQVVAISANGMKHLLAHVPNQELASAWLQYLIDAEQHFKGISPADARITLRDDHVNNHRAVFEHLGVKKGVAAIGTANTMTWSQTSNEIRKEIKEQKGLKGKAENVKEWHHASEGSMAAKSLATGCIRLAAIYAPREASAKDIGRKAARATIDIVEDLSGGDGVEIIRGKNGHFRKAIHFQIREGPAMSPATAKQLKEKDKQCRKDEASLTESCQQELL